MLNRHRTTRAPSAARRIVVGLLVVATTALGLSTVTLSTATPAAAASSSWPTAWTTYTLANGNPVRDHTGDIPQEPDLGSGPCSGGGGGGCLGTSDTVYYASDGTNAFFRFRMSSDNNDASKGGYFGSAFIVRLYDAADTLKAVVGVNGKESTADYVYVVDTDGNQTVTPVNSTVSTYPWTGGNEGSRWIPDGAGQYFLDVQVPIAAIRDVWPQYTAGTPVKLYYGSSQAANLATINKDFMIAGDTTEAAMLASLGSLAVVKVADPVVTFDSQGGSAVATQTLTGATTTATRPTVPTRSGYVFNGWHDAASGGTLWSFGTTITADTTLYAQWTADLTGQTITFDQPAGREVGGTFTPTPSSSSGLTVSLTSTSPLVCTVSSGTVTAVAAGTCTLAADQAGNGTYAAAPTVTRSLTVAKKPQVITFDPIANAAVGDTRPVAATSSSGAPVAVTSATPSVCTVSGGTVTTTGTGTCTIHADQAGDATYAAASRVTRSFGVAPVGLTAQTITFTQPSTGTVGDTFTPAPTSDSGLPVTVSSATPSVCTVSGGTVTAVAAGTCTLEADQAGNDTWAAAPQVARSLTVAKKPQTITVTQPADLPAESVFDLGPRASSGLPVTMVSTTTAVCTVADGIVALLEPGTCSLVAAQAGNGTYLPAPDVPIVFPVTATSLEPQAITFTTPSVLLSGAGAVPLAASATSSLSVSLALVSGECGLTGGSLSAPEDTTCVVSASQDGDRHWLPAERVTRTIRFVSPVDDIVAMASPLTGARSTDVRMLANDPVELALQGAGSPNHGSLEVGGDTWLTYTPQEKFHGVDEFSYTVSDVLGRTAQAMVRVDVANAAPVVSGGTIEQLAGTTATVTIEASDPNDDAVTLGTRSVRHVDSSIDGRTVRVSPDETVSGWTVVKVRAADDFGGSAVAAVRSLVTPLPVARAERRLVDVGTVVSWPESATADARYKILVDDKFACVTVETSCTIHRLLGPDFTVEVQVLGLDGTSSSPVRAEARGHQQVLLRTVYFEPGIATLGPAQTRRLTSVAALIRRIGFHDAHVSGYTDSDGGAAYNLALSRHRTQMVATYLQRTRQIDSAQAWFGYNDPVAPNDSAAGKSLNRRVEILVSY